MSVRRAIDVGAWLVTIAVAVGVMAGSAVTLFDIGGKTHMAAPWSLPLALDGLAVVAALAVHRRRNWWPWTVLIVAVGVSTWLQVTGGPAALAHAAVPISALVAFDLLIRATETDTPAEGPAGEGPAGEGPAGEGPAGEGPAAKKALKRKAAPEDSPYVVDGQRIGPALDRTDRAIVLQEADRRRRAVAAEGRTPATTLTVAPDPGPAPADEPDDELLPVARRLAAGQPGGRFPSRQALADAIKAETGQGIGTSRAQKLHAATRKETP